MRAWLISGLTDAAFGMFTHCTVLCRSQLWEKKEPQWEHDGFLELTKGDTAPPRMVWPSAVVYFGLSS